MAKNKQKKNKDETKEKENEYEEKPKKAHVLGDPICSLGQINKKLLFYF